MVKPGTDGCHHYGEGLLLAHLHSVTKNAMFLSERYPGFSRDLIIFGSSLHDIGKINDYTDFDGTKNPPSTTNVSIDLLGHSYEGTHLVENYISRQPNFPVDLRLQALHMVGSHMRNTTMDGGALVEPKMGEVIIINFADHIDAFAEEAERKLKDVKPNEWSEVVENLNRTLLRACI
jgi:3'-5' exoribonuclease